MKALLLICAGMLFLAIPDLPVGYSYFLMLAITFVSVYIVKLIWEKNGKKLNPWYIVFSVCAILYNPFTSIILFIEQSNHFLGMLIHETFGLLFILKYFFSLGDKKMSDKELKKFYVITKSLDKEGKDVVGKALEAAANNPNLNKNLKQNAFTKTSDKRRNKPK